MTIDPEPDLPDDADPTDVLAQFQDVVSPAVDDEAPAPEPFELPLEANEADVADQWTEAPGGAAYEDAEER
jgi:hypothetical protein